MSVPPQDDLLTVLRSNLSRIEEEHRDEDLPPAARDLKRLLLRRIANIEAAFANLNKIIANSSAAQSDHSGDANKATGSPLQGDD